jgi:phage FluMu gp28-like protein
MIGREAIHSTADLNEVLPLKHADRKFGSHHFGFNIIHTNDLSVIVEEKQRDQV